MHKNIIIYRIPGKDQIRPSKFHLQAKANEMMNIEQFYESTNDYIYVSVFNYETIVSSISNKLVAIIPPTHNKDNEEDDDKDTRSNKPSSNNNNNNKHIFVPNNYPYQLDEGSKHYVLWYNKGKPIEGDDRINKDIYDALLSQLGHTNFEFVWYVIICYIVFCFCLCFAQSQLLILLKVCILVQFGLVNFFKFIYYSMFF